jgi:hypothetical protein
MHNGEPKKRNKKTKDLNPSPVAQSKSCKEIGEKCKRTSSLEKAFSTITTSHCKIVAA